MSESRFPDVTVQLSVEDGNAAAIISRVARALRRGGHGEHVSEFAREARSGDYDNVIVTAMKWVTVE